MGSRREEERNEKIIRGLMKLPPNRRCINCNSLGPQYVCTNFWTFVCMTCSGIHREFTHRVKSVSMAKFTSQEVEALQNGGNQRAREIYMKDWDQQRQKLPDNSKIDKIREFIKAVYVDRRYAGGRSEKPPRDMQIMRSQEETRRASSYHSYSQSPPYDYQYEDRRYGKQGAALTRKPGSDRGLYEGKVSNLIYSPGRSSEPMYEDRFANEGSAPRVSDYSVSSGGDTFRSGAQSPNFQKDSEFNSPRQQLSKNISGNNLSRQTSNTFVEVNFRRDTNGIPHAQRTASLGSFDSFGSNSVSIKSYNSGSLLDFLSESEQTSGNHQDKLSGFPTSTVSESSSTVEQFKSQLVPEQTTPDASSNDLFKAAATSITPSLDLFQPNVADQTSFAFIHEAPQAPSSTPLDLFADFPQNQSDAILESRTPELSEPKNEGWATFDSPNSTAAAPTAENLPPALVASNGDPIGKIAPLSSFDPNVDWHIPEKSGSQDLLTLVSDPWHVGLDNTKVSTIASNGQAWNAFGESAEQFPSESAKVNSEAQLASHNPPSRADHQYLGFEVSQDLNHFALPASTSFAGPSGQSLPSDVMGLSCTPLSADEYVGFKASKDFKDYEPPASTSFAGLSGQDGPPVVEVATSGHMGATEYRSTNPFDVPFSSDLDQSNMFLDMGSLQAALPNAQFPSTLLGSVNESWFPQDPLGPYVAAAPPGGLAYIAGQAPSSQMPNVPTQGPVASIGGNPFA